MYVEDNSNIHAQRWDVYTRYKEELINRFFGVGSASNRG